MAGGQPGCAVLEGRPASHAQVDLLCELLSELSHEDGAVLAREPVDDLEDAKAGEVARPVRVGLGHDARDLEQVEPDDGLGRLVEARDQAPEEGRARDGDGDGRRQAQDPEEAVEQALERDGLGVDEARNEAVGRPVLDQHVLDARRLFLQPAEGSAKLVSRLKGARFDDVGQSGTDQTRIESSAELCQYGSPVSSR